MIRLLNSPTSHSCKCGDWQTWNVTDIKIPTGLYSFLRRAYLNSLTKKLLATMRSTLIQIIRLNQTTSGIKTLPNISSNSFSQENSEDCSPLEKLDADYKATLAFDYLVYSKAPICWGKKHKDAAQSRGHGRHHYRHHRSPRWWG